MPAQMTLTAWRQGAKNALVCGIGVLVSGWVIAAAISSISGQPRSDSLRAVFAVLCGFSWLLFLGTWINGRANAGRVLLDCGPHPTRTLLLINTGLLVIVALYVLAAPSVSRADAIVELVVWVSVATSSLIMGAGRLQVRENGIWQYTSLLRWDKIGSYRWADDSTLVVRRKGPLAFFKGALPVPPEHRQAIEGFFAERCGATRPN